VENHRELEVAVTSLFDSLDSLAMYPICEYLTEMEGEVVVPVVTHFLIEASNCMPLLQDATNATNIVCNPEVRRDLWRAAPAHAIA
jgi:hypothetical protein